MRCAVYIFKSVDNAAKHAILLSDLVRVDEFEVCPPKCDTRRGPTNTAIVREHDQMRTIECRTVKTEILRNKTLQNKYDEKSHSTIGSDAAIIVDLS